MAEKEEDAVGEGISIDEYEDRFSEIDNALDDLRSSIFQDDGVSPSTDETKIDDDDDDDGSNENTEPPEPKPSRTDSTQTDPTPTPASSSQSTKKASSTRFYLIIAITVIVAIFLGQKLSSPSSTTLPVPIGGDVKVQIQQEQPLPPQQQAINYQEKRKIEKCTYAANGEKYCESDEVERSATGGGESESGNGIYQYQAFQKCWYKNGRSVCQSFEKSLSSGNNNKAKQLSSFQKEQLYAEFCAADVDQDGQVCQAEFEQYKKRYLQAHPEADSTFANYEDFDKDSNGFISVDEHQSYYTALGLL